MSARSTAKPASPKVPPAVDFRFPDGSERGIQVNFCKNPRCANYGVPASLAKYARRAKAAPGLPGTDYRVGGSGAGLPVLQCLLCGESLPIKSNAGVAEELARLASHLVEPDSGCRNEDCPFFNVPLNAELHNAFGKTAQGTPRYRCKDCKRTFTAGGRSTLRQRLTHKNHNVFMALVNKVPMSRLCEVCDISPQTLYRKLDFIHRQTLKVAAAQERKLMDGALFRRLYVSVDRQDYAVNWTARKDKRNVVLRAIGSADVASGFVFGMHLNFDGRLDGPEVEADAIKAGDYTAPVPRRRYARLWLAPDYTKAVQESADRAAKRLRAGGTLGDDIVARYADTEARTDVESPETILASESLPKTGMQVHNEYTMYAHFYCLRQMLRGAEKVRFFMDQESGIRAAYLAAFEQEVRERRSDAFYVRLGKEMTVDEKRKVLRESRARFAEVQAANPELTDFQVEVLMMKREMARAASFGKWSDKWLVHPLPNASEPLKAICYLTDFGDYDEDHLARLCLRATLHPIDRFFMLIRRRLSLLERPIGTSSKAGRIWSGYSAYQPANIEKVLDIFRVFYNYTLEGKDARTPAMRLGIIDRPVPVSSILSE